jgi:arylsulfatase A-like enzyme
MADDLGYGDTGFNGHSIIKTPHLDMMANEGAVMTNFHAASPVCSPTRGSVLTGRHAYRYGIFHANTAHLPKEELTLPELLKESGYNTGHFGKWHLGTLSKEFSAKGRKRKPSINYSPPAWHGYDESFVTESAVQTWNPSQGTRAKNNPFWLNGAPVAAEDPTLQGGAGRVVMDRALDFVNKSAKTGKPFFMVVWFHAPHAPVVAGPKYLAMYPNEGAAAHYYGAITEMDEQVGRLRERLKQLDLANNTFISFTSDNGPEGKGIAGRFAGTAGELRGRKRSLYEGGVRVPTLMLHPGLIKAGQRIDTASSTLDYLPTALALAEQSYPSSRPLDGNNLMRSLTAGTEVQRNIPFYHSNKLALIKGNYKLLVSDNNFSNEQLYLLSEDISEKNNIADQHPEIVANMKKIITDFVLSARKSHSGEDYENNADFTPVDLWPTDPEKIAANKKRKAKKKNKNKKKKKKNKKEAQQ